MKKIKNFFIVTTKKLHNLSFSSTNIQCKSLIDKYTCWFSFLSDLCLVKFIIYYNTKAYIKKKSFNGFILTFTKSHKIIIDNYIFLFKPFHKSKFDLKKNVSWKDVYINEKDNIEMLQKTFCI